VDYNFVSIEEFFSLEESGALLESGKFKGQNQSLFYIHFMHLNQWFNAVKIIIFVCLFIAKYKVDKEN